MNWTKTPPGEPGYYWTRRAFSDGSPSDPEVVLLDEQRIVHFFRENEIGQPASATSWLSWCPKEVSPPSGSDE